MEKKKGKAGKIIKNIFSVIAIVPCLILVIAANTILMSNYRMVDSILNGIPKKIDNSKVDTSGLNLNYYEQEYDKTTITTAEDALKKDISDEGLVLLQNEGNALPKSADTVYSLISANTNISVGGGLLGGGAPLTQVLTDSGLKISETLVEFYTNGKGKDYGLASGSISYGDAEDFRINECPLSVLESEGVLNSLEGTTPIYFLKRVAGEGRDMPRSMYNHAGSAEDKELSYLDIDSTEREIIEYLNSNFDEVILVVNSNAALNLGWVSEYPSIKAVINAPDGLLALGDVLTGAVNPSGRTVDTFAVDALSSPAAQNFGDYQYSDESGALTKYNYVSYEEGIYVGYRYYETRYEDSVLGQGNAGNFNYDEEVLYPFGYGLSYTSFEWSNMNVTWNGDVCTVSVDVENTGDVPGKDVVEIYAQSPYTDYDQANGIEKASVELVGYVKTSLLPAGGKETVSTTFNKDQLKAYDENGAGTYILDAGTYYITAATNAHAATDQILALKKGTGADTQLVKEYIPDNTDTDLVTYSVDSFSGVKITNQLTDASKAVTTYLSRSDWTGTFPTHDGVPSSQVSTWGNEINGSDGVSYTYTKTISSENLAKLDSTDSGAPDVSYDDEIIFGQNNNLSLIDLRGVDYDDEKWDLLLNQLTKNDYYETIALSGYGIEYIDSVNKPFNIDADTAAGLIYGGTGSMYPNPMTLAQTWNIELAKRVGEMIGEAALVGGADGWYAPSMNIHRTPFSGRNGEYYSEDPFISGNTASAEVVAAAQKGVYAYIKHFAFNDQEDHRGDRTGQYSVATFLNEQSAREIYLYPFEMCMKAGDVTLRYVTEDGNGGYTNADKQIRACQAIMTAFNRIGYTWTGGSYNLITGIVRNEWDFDGMIITDNANTGVFMGAKQMIEAGGDMKLTYADSSALFDEWKNVESDPTLYHHAREAMHHVLYTVANSKSMNGAMPGSVFKNPLHISAKVRIAVTIICPILILLLILGIVKRSKRAVQ